MEQAAAPSAIREAHPPRRAHSELVYGIEDVPPRPQARLGALPHMVGRVGGGVTP
ncbi:xanthine permease XanP, partial [Aeromonas caviae]